MSKKSLPILFPMFVLLFASLACSALSGGAVSSAKATANAVFTQAAAGAATAGVQGSSAEATANAAATEAIATANAATGGNSGDVTKTPAADQPTAEATTAGGGTTANGGPSDIPLVDGKNTIQLATAKQLVYISSVDLATATKFYKDSMPKAGWTPVEALTVEIPNANTLGFSKDNRTATILIATANGQTVVTIAVQ